jgi:hypothetical protein
MLVYAYHNWAGLSSFGPRIPWPERAAPGGSRLADRVPFPIDPVSQKENAIARTLMKHVARRQDQSFAAWCAEIRELAGERWPEFSDQGPAL